MRSNSRCERHMNISRKVPEGALVVPYAITDAKEWWCGWYRGKDDDGYDLVESVETHRICKFTNCGFLFLDNLEFASNPTFRYSDREWGNHRYYQETCSTP